MIGKICFYLGIWCLLLMSACHEEKEAAIAEKPNIVFFIADDMYPYMFNNLPEGKGKNLTPHLDKLIEEGVFFNNLLVASPVCTPSRYNVLTGNYASRAVNEEFVTFTEKNEGQTVIQWNSFITPGIEKTIGSLLQEEGYKTGFVGKNHVIESKAQIDQSKKPDLDADPTNPDIKELLVYRHKELQERIKESGFDYADNLYHDNPNWLGIKALAYQNMDWIAEGGVRFIERYQEDPIFLYFATTLPHHPTDPAHSWKSDPRITAKGILDEPPTVLPSRSSLETRIKDAGLENTKRENILWMDDALGALLDRLESTDRLDNTIIFFFNDHGQTAKGTLYNGGIQSQGFVWKKGGFSCSSNLDIPISNVDFLPTILEMAGRKDVNNLCDGYSFLPLLKNEPYEPRESHYFELGFARAVVKDGFKYLTIRYPSYAADMSLAERELMLQEYNEFRESFGNKAINLDPTLPFGHLEMFPGGGGAEHGTYGKKAGFFDPDQLYDLKNDPTEENNLASDPEYQEKLKELRAELQAWIEKLPGKYAL